MRVCCDDIHSGNIEYRISYISSGRVTANTLTIQQPFDENQILFLETILTTSDGTIQYQLRTQVGQAYKEY